jgi:hypothetical protein
MENDQGIVISNKAIDAYLTADLQVKKEMLGMMGTILAFVQAVFQAKLDQDMRHSQERHDSCMTTEKEARAEARAKQAEFSRHAQETHELALLLEKEQLAHEKLRTDRLHLEVKEMQDRMADRAAREAREKLEEKVAPV